MEEKKEIGLQKDIDAFCDGTISLMDVATHQAKEIHKLWIAIYILSVAVLLCLILLFF